MVARYEIVYSIAIAFCIINTLIIMSKLNYNVGSATEIRLFRRMCLSFIGFLVLEILWILSISRIIPVSSSNGWLLKMLDTLMVPLMVFYWFMFSMARFKAREIQQLKYRVIAAVPLVILAALYITSFQTGLIFKIDDYGFERGPLYLLTGIVSALYGAFVIAYALYCRKIDKPGVKKDEYYIEIVFILICVAGMLADGFMSMTPVTALVITLAFNYLFVHTLERQIYNDALTGLNNRRRADAYVEESIETASKKAPCYVFLMDVDKFKKVNSTYGHLEGDRALKAVANALRRVAGKYKGLLSRWGGDEFILVLRNQPDLEPGEIEKSTNRMLKTIVKEQELPYDLRMSVGYCRCDSKNMTFDDVIGEANKVMHDKKKSA